jgi:WD40 repeat protein/DNA-binding SARP family transcriptional activator
MTLQRDFDAVQEAGMIRFHVLGALEICDDTGPLNIGGARQRRLVAMLLVHRNEVVSVDRLADAVFAGDPTPAAATTLRSYVARLRRVIDADSALSLVTQAPGYVLHIQDDAFDVARFEAMTDAARIASQRGDHPAAATLLSDALALWRGDPYAEFDDEEWAQPEAQRLTELRLVAQELRFDAELAGGRAADLVPELEAAARANPWREGLRAQLMVALYRSGRHREALQAFQAHREALVEELGLDPGPALSELEERILRHDQDLLLPRTSDAVVRGYVLGQRLGSGQDGTVHAAYLPGVDRDVVLRSLRPEVADDPELVREFDPLLRRVAALDHPGILPVHDHWREPGQAQIVVRRLHGGSLADRLERGPLPAADVVAFVRRVGGALAAAEEAGVRHGAVTARNVLFDSAGAPYLTDFTVPGMATTGRDDVHDLALLAVAAFGGEPPDPVDEVLTCVLGGERPAVAELVDRLLNALTGSSRIHAPVNPYKGLRAFDEGDAEDYYGRAALIDDLVERLGTPGTRGRLLLVVGGSGTGKSSAVRAGLLPRIRRGDVAGSERWLATTMLPGPTPFKELAEALGRVATEADVDALRRVDGDGGLDVALGRLCPPGVEVLLVIDQLEELFTSSPEDQQRAFLDAIVDAIEADESCLRVVATLRADFFDRPLAFHRFGRLVEAATVPIPAMVPAEIEAAIVEPALRAGRRIEGALVAELVSAVANEPGALPALQFTLFDLAEREGEAIRLEAYRALGGVDGAIAASAEQLYRSLDDDGRPAVRAVFEQLVTVGHGGPPTRRVVPRAELVEDGVEGASEVVDRWAEARMLTLDRQATTRAPTVEVAHEALLHEWPRLRRWIEEDHDRLVVLANLRDAAAAWEELDRDPGALYRGARLQAALDVASRSPALPTRQQAFLDASREERDREVQAAADQATRQARVNRRLRQQLALTGVALVVALVGGVIALDQRGEAEAGRRIATVRELAAAAQASLAEDPERALLLALEAIAAGDRDDPAPEAVDALHRATTSSRILLTVPGLGGSIDWSPDGALFVTEGPEEEGLVDLRDAETGESVLAFRGHEIDINDVEFSPDSELLATAGDDSALRVWDVATGREVLDVRGEHEEDVVWGASFSGDGRLVAGSWFDEGVVRVVDVDTGDVVLEVADAPSWTAELDPTGTRIFIAAFDQDPVVLDVRSGEPVLALDGEQQTIRVGRWSPDGRSIAAGGSNGTAVVWDAATGERRITFTGHTAEVSSVDWSRDGTKLATSSHDGTARVHELLEGGARELHVVFGLDTRNGLQSVAFSPDGERIMTGDWGIAAVKVWDVSDQAGGEMAVVPSVPFSRGGGAFLPNGQALVAGMRDGGLGVWDTTTGELLRSLPVTEAGEGEVYRLALHPEGELVAVTTDLLPAQLYDLRTGDHMGEVGPTSPPCGPPEDGPPCRFVVTMEWSPDGQHLAIAEGTDHGGGGALLVADRSGREVTRVEEEAGTYIRDLAWSPDGTRIVTTRLPSRDDPAQMGVRVWDTAEGDLLLRVKTQAVGVAWDPTGDRIVTTKQTEGGADVWDAASGQHLTELRATAPFYAVAFAPGGGRVATTGGDGVIRFWDVARGVQVEALRGSTRELNALELSADGRLLSSLDDQGSLRVWILDLDELIEVARSRVTRELTDEECRQYLQLERCDAR